MKRTERLGIACALLMLAAPVGARAANRVAGGVVGNGGTPSAGATANGRVLYGTAGQAAVGSGQNASNDLCSGFWCTGGVQVLSVGGGPDGRPVPRALAFGPPTPDPMVERVEMTLSLPRAADVRVDIYDVQGRRVGAMHAGRLDPGVYRLEWNGTDGAGHASGAGVYFARLRVDGRFAAQRRFVRLR